VEKESDRRVVVEVAPEGADPALVAPAQVQRKVFLVQVKEVKEKNLPTLDDEYARALGDFEDLADLRSKVGKDLEEYAEAEARRFVVGQAIDKLIQKNAVEVPESLIRRYLAGVVEDFKSSAQDQPIDEEAIRQQYRGVAQVQMKWQLLQMRIAEQEGLEVTEEEVRERVNGFAENHNIDPKEAYRALAGQGQIDRIRADIREGKVVDLIIEGAKIKEKKVKAEEREAPKAVETTERGEPARPASGLITTDIRGFEEPSGSADSGEPKRAESTPESASKDALTPEDAEGSPGEEEGQGGSGLIIPGR
jgi:hypothetical protein